MKINREARRAARKLFRACLVKGRMDDQRVRNTVSILIKEKPRHYLPILSTIERLTRMEAQKHALVIESATPLAERHAQEIHQQVQKRVGRSLTSSHRVNPGLIGGLRVRLGSDVWDGSIAERLNQLKILN